MSSIAAALMALAIQNGAFETMNITGLGDVGVKKLTTGERDQVYKDWSDAKEAGKKLPISAFILKATLVDPSTGDLALSDVSVSELAMLPPSVTDDFAEKTYHLNGFSRKKDDADKDLKN